MLAFVREDGRELNALTREGSKLLYDFEYQDFTGISANLKDIEVIK